MTDKTAAQDAVKAPSLPLFYQQPLPLDRVRHRRERGGDPTPHLFWIVFGDHPDVVDEVGEERRHDAPIPRLDAQGPCTGSVGGRVGRASVGLDVERRAAPVAESGARRSL